MENHTPSLTALSSVDDHLPLARLAPRLQKRVLKRLDCILKIEDAEPGKKGLAVSMAAAELKVSIPTVHRFLRAYREEGWQGLIDHRGGYATPLPAAFRDAVEAHRRSSIQNPWLRCTAARRTEGMAGRVEHRHNLPTPPGQIRADDRAPGREESGGIFAEHPENPRGNAFRRCGVFR
jgi:hypothetical protein